MGNKECGFEMHSLEVAQQFQPGNQSDPNAPEIRLHERACLTDVSLKCFITMLCLLDEAVGGMEAPMEAGPATRLLHVARIITVEPAIFLQVRNRFEK